MYSASVLFNCAFIDVTTSGEDEDDQQLDDALFQTTPESATPRALTRRRFVQAATPSSTDAT